MEKSFMCISKNWIKNFVYEISLDPIISEEQQDTLKNKSMMYTIKELL